MKDTYENFPFTSELYKIDPKEFERVSRLEIEDAISHARPELQDRLRGLQFRIDSTLRKYKNPQMRIEKMSQLLFEYGINRLNEALHPVPFATQKKTLAKVVSLFPKSK